MPDEIDHIADLQKRLYARDPDAVPKRKFGILRPIKQNVASSWGETEIPKQKSTFHTNVKGYKRFFIFSLLFFTLALGAALFSIYRGALTVSSKNVDVVILGNSFIGGGEELPIQIEIANKNSAALVDAVLRIDYPKGATDVSGSDIVHLERQLGVIPSGKTKSEAFTVILYGEQGISRTIKATLTYKLESASAMFQKESSFSVMISSSPIALTVEGPTTIASNQPFSFTVRNNFSGDTLLGNVVTRVEYPSGFVFQSASPAPSSGNNIWALGDLAKGSEKVISINGRMVGEVNDEKAFRVYVGTPETELSSRIAVTYNSVLHSMLISQPFIAGSLIIGGQTGDTASVPIGSPVSGTVQWINNSAYTVTNPVFTLSLTGDSIDLRTVAADDSYFNQLDRTITWTPESNNTLVSIAPGTRGSLPFSFSTKALPSEINLTLSIEGILPERNFLEQRVANIDQKIIRFASNVQFAAKALYSVGALKNSGPYPPKADVETSYTINWTMNPVENPLTGVTATAVIPNGTVWTGVVAPQSENITYSPDTRTVIWHIGSMPRNSAQAKPRTVSFQVKSRPTKSQIGSDIKLLGETSIKATDAVTNTVVTATHDPLTSKLDKDPAYTTGKERVIP